MLLILAAISIATLTGENGILTKARDAKEQTEIADVKERVQTDILGVQAENKSGDIENGTFARESNKTLAKDVLATDITATEAAAKSPYVNYNGLDCRVLYNDETHGIQIITAENIKNGNVTLGYGDTEVDFIYDGTATANDNFKKAAASYNNAVDNLNKRAKTYMDTKGIAIDARCLGSVPTLGSNSKFQGDASEMWSGSYQYLTDYKWNNKFKNNDTNYTKDVQQLNDLGLNGSSGYTWLASRYVSSISGSAGFNVRNVDSSGDTRGNYLCRVYSVGALDSDAPSNGFRPVFLLPSNVIISSGDGSSEYPYVIK